MSTPPTRLHLSHLPHDLTQGIGSWPLANPAVNQPKRPCYPCYPFYPLLPTRFSRSRLTRLSGLYSGAYAYGLWPALSYCPLQKQLRRNPCRQLLVHSRLASTAYRQRHRFRRNAVAKEKSCTSASELLAT